jgi:hypothetical protein
MPVLAYIHQLCNAEHCQAYIHTLRWQERPLPCILFCNLYILCAMDVRHPWDIG